MTQRHRLILFVALMLTITTIACGGGRRSDGGTVETPTDAPLVEEATTAPPSATREPAAEAPADPTQPPAPTATQPTAPTATVMPTEGVDEQMRDDAEQALEELEQLLGQLETLNAQTDDLGDTP